LKSLKDLRKLDKACLSQQAIFYKKKKLHEKNHSFCKTECRKMEKRMKLPCEILFLICGQNHWSNPLPFLLSCKKVRDYFLSNGLIVLKSRRLYEILNETQQVMNNVDGTKFQNIERDNVSYNAFLNQVQLKKWTTNPFALSSTHPIHERVSAWLKDHLQIVRRALNETTESIDHEASDAGKHFSSKGNFFITGGQICQIAFNKVWDSDIDVFVASAEEGRVSKTIDGHPIDIVFCNVSSPEKVLRRFDISLCQIGVLVDYMNDSYEVYVTPLFMCSTMFNVFAIQVSDLSCSYNVAWVPGEPAFKNVEDRFFKHLLFHIPEARANDVAGLQDFYKEDFVECPRCRYPIEGPHIHIVSDQEGHFFRWAARIAKYQARFPNFEKQYFVARKFPGEQRKRLKVN
jgi:hypothetical protein